MFISPTTLSLLQVSCTATPSPIEGGASQCTWNHDDSSCNLRPPPTDAVYIIMVSLVTLLLGIPPSIFVTILLDEYASKWPGKVESDVEPAKETTIDEAYAQSPGIVDRVNPQRNKAGDSQIICTRNAIRQASKLNSATTSNTTGDAAMYTYCNGENPRRLVIRNAMFRRTASYHSRNYIMLHLIALFLILDIFLLFDYFVETCFLITACTLLSSTFPTRSKTVSLHFFRFHFSKRRDESNLEPSTLIPLCC
jgi:hypothetical protein